MRTWPCTKRKPHFSFVQDSSGHGPRLALGSSPTRGLPPDPLARLDQRPMQPPLPFLSWRQLDPVLGHDDAVLVHLQQLHLLAAGLDAQTQGSLKASATGNVPVWSSSAKAFSMPEPWEFAMAVRSKVLVSIWRRRSRTLQPWVAAMGA